MEDVTKKYNTIVGTIESCADDLIEIILSTDNEEFELYREVCYRLSIFAQEIK